ncbi:MAG: hypothetical protein A2268_06290 [Candidatus Raymondbacteria bacterium RifOxyA12_full_50_37]|uniref:Ribonuclease VapC n=1 Tax=Candidatus Raymondbacteria bacterium RIFOXYD12_FULL_49_13 TaxID=1817890 RepID=A0A1F7FKS7_UNCRA|nr:MAG: hypothetical protein A2268_06290 [Candidatus Raymondbacteria bacterium RifOxyA12_full_50_37]OGJ94577.1 MAG: hypothetical protein A2248_15220 [Candidatus Raymondbacteria bacterium RIFOXYA2_FULL_49_16]OGK00217.1 MAG: hypothetical protein A2350_13350 [Candidatus Raymondbacteria bacterium RifOxyB12_full_50_8]OGK03007.1 MAG: hypothetical protein A2487_14760 [Candidatus Raymondbacteria bacterium RifOxyC12_full_50_8]OGK07052.1 MAG: hypothetical protein A2519_13860 [Candidatus Raymondbacteria b
MGKADQVKKRHLVDTDILIDALRGTKAAQAFLETHETAPLISAITVTELFSGVRNEKEKREVSDFCRAFETVPLTEEIAIRAGILHQRYSRSHGTGLADAVVAATAEVSGVILATGNKKHFPMVENILNPYSK